MTPAGLRLLADYSLAAIAAGVSLAPEMIRNARDDATAPHAEIPAAALRRVWLWSVASAAPSRTAAALACGVSRPSVRRACEAVEAWESDVDTFESMSPVAGMTAAAAAVIAGASDLQRLVTLAAIADRRAVDAERAKRKRAAPRKVAPSRPVLELERQARAAGDDARADHYKRLAVVPKPKQVRSRDVHRVRGAPPTL